MPSVKRLVKRLRRRISVQAVDWLIANPEIVPHSRLRRWTESIYRDERCRQIVVNELKELKKGEAPQIEDFEPDFGVGDSPIGFEALAPLFASTTLNEYLITMNVRQAAYLFHLIRAGQVEKVIEIGRQWGGTTVLIAAAMNGEGSFWSISDPHELDWDIHHRGRTVHRPIKDQLDDLLPRLGLRAVIIEGSAEEVEHETGGVDLIHIDGRHDYRSAMSDFERFGRRVRIGGSVLFDDAAPDPFCDTMHTADVKRVVADIVEHGDFKVDRVVQRLVHLKRVR